MKRQHQWAIAAVVALLVAAGAWRALAARSTQQQALAAASRVQDNNSVELAATDVVKAGLRELVQGLPISGTLKAVDSAVIKARVAGELQGLSVREGDAVQAGQVLARIESADYALRLRQAREQAASSRAQADVARRQFVNNQALVDQGFISRTALETSEANLLAAEATWRAAVAGSDVAAKSVEDTVLRSPISGQVAQRMVQSGERVGVDAKVLEVVNLRRLEVEVSLDAQQAAQVAVGQTALLRVEGNPADVPARVVRISPSVQAGSRSLLVYLALGNLPATQDGAGSAPAMPLLRQGLFAQGTLGTGQGAVLAVPLSSVRTDQPQPYVQTIENGRVVHRTVVPGVRGTAPAASLAGAEALLAVSGIADGTPVLRGNIGTLREGTQVRFTAIATNGAAAPGKPASQASAARPAP